MLSILIPTYNYNVDNLLSAIVSQSEKLDFECEIIVGDDCSLKSIITDFSIKNTKVVIIKNNNNIGRTETRQKLAEKSKYKWLLFLDSDVLPSNDNFLSNYFNKIDTETKVIYGGINYQKKQKKQNINLRLHYGLKKEVIPAKKRQLNPYKVLASANLMIERGLFISINKNLKGNHYGYDNVFALNLKERKIKILHIENPVWHLGLETNDVYLRKKEKSTETVYHLYKSNKIDSGSNDLLKAYEFCKKYKLNHIIGKSFSIFRPILKINLLSKYSSAFILNVYKLGYLCNLEVNDK